MRQLGTIMWDSEATKVAFSLLAIYTNNTGFFPLKKGMRASAERLKKKVCK